MTLKCQPQAELNLPRRIGLTQNYMPERRRGDAGAGSGENNMVQGVEQLGAESEMEAFANLGVLFGEQVPIPGAWIVHIAEIAADVPEGECRRLGEGGRIEIGAVCCNLRTAGKGGGNSGRVWTLAAASSAGIGVVG